MPSLKEEASTKICGFMFHYAKASDDVSWHHVGTKNSLMFTQLLKELCVIEIFVCPKRWAEIEFGIVPSLCMDRQKHAFLNKNKKDYIAHPEDLSRTVCHHKLLTQIVYKGAKALKGKQLFPHELVQQVLLF